MKWQRGYRSDDVVDRRGGVGLGSGLSGPFVAIGSKFGILGILAAVGFRRGLTSGNIDACNTFANAPL